MDPRDARPELKRDGGSSRPPADAGGHRGRLTSVAAPPTTPFPSLPLDATGDPSTLVAELVERFALADRHGAVARVRELLASGVDDREVRDVVGLAIRHVGELWQAGHWTITQEHAATAVAEAVLTSLEVAASHADPVGAVAVVAADGEWHALPARLASHAFEHVGLAVRYLGAGHPADDVARTLPGADVDVLAVSVTMVGNLPGAARTVAAGRAAGMPVLVGGAAVTEARAAAIGADGYAATVDGGAELARSWCVGGRPTDVPTPSLDRPAHQRLCAASEGLRDAAFAATAERWPDLEDAAEHVIDRVCEDLELQLDHLATALLLRDPSAYLDLVPWLADVQAGRRLPAGAIEAQLDGLREALADQPAARELVETARRHLRRPATT
ncbi:hypothetical protein FTX61_05015 [Nitriliruptoraceae bacterium ZYF776]|nr:hypothetical protein [Profundirhabdus halotolerans]